MSVSDIIDDVAKKIEIEQLKPITSLNKEILSLMSKKSEPKDLHHLFNLLIKLIHLDLIFKLEFN